MPLRRAYANAVHEEPHQVERNAQPSIDILRGQPEEEDGQRYEGRHRRQTSAEPVLRDPFPSTPLAPADDHLVGQATCYRRPDDVAQAHSNETCPDQGFVVDLVALALRKLSEGVARGSYGTYNGIRQRDK